MPGDTCDRTYEYPHLCKIPSMIEKSPVPKSLSTVLSQMPNRNFVAANATLVTATLCFYSSTIEMNSTLSCFILIETFRMTLQQETLYFGYTYLGSHVQFQVSNSNRSCGLGHTCELAFLRKFHPGVDCDCFVTDYITTIAF